MNFWCKSLIRMIEFICKPWFSWYAKLLYYYLIWCLCWALFCELWYIFYSYMLFFSNYIEKYLQRRPNMFTFVLLILNYDQEGNNISVVAATTCVRVVVLSSLWFKRIRHIYKICCLHWRHRIDVRARDI